MNERAWLDAVAALDSVRRLQLDDAAVRALVAHAHAVLEANELLHLTTITDLDEFVARHIEESLLGAALLPPGTRGRLLDLGSGNGFPGIPLAIAHPGLVPLLAESVGKKAQFLERALRAAGLSQGRVWPHNVQRPGDLPQEEAAPAGLRVIASRAMGGWQKILPRLVSTLGEQGCMLLWAGEEADEIARRKAWDRLERVGREPIPGRDRSWIHQFRRKK